jgi:uncharacterized protein
MNRIFILQQAMFELIEQNRNIDRTDSPSLDWERIHMISCAKVGYMMAFDRGLDPEFCACACAVHDFGRIITGSQKNHGPAGAVPVQDFLRKTNLFSKDEILMIALAVLNHSKKEEVGSPLEELVKDADLVDYYSYGQTFKRQDQIDRFEKITGKDGFLGKIGFLG